MNRNYSVICYIVSYILSMTCMPALATACWITDTMIQQRCAGGMAVAGHYFKCACHCAAGEKTGSHARCYQPVICIYTGIVYRSDRIDVTG